MSRKVLIIDDALADRRNLESIVGAAGHLVISAESGEEALRRTNRDLPDVILMNMNMPDMDGFVATRRLKADPATKDIPVDFVSRKNPQADIGWGTMFGAKGYVCKPYTPEQFLEQIKA